MSFEFAVVLITGLLVLGLGLVAYIRNKNSRVNITLFLLTIFVSGWLFFNYLVDTTNNFGNALILLRLTNMFGSLAIYALFLFSLFFPENSEKKISAATWLYSIPSLFVAILTLSPYYYVGIERRDWGYLGVNGTLFYAFPVYALVTILVALSIFIYRYRKTVGRERLQMKFVFLGLFASAFLSVLTNIILPLLFNLNSSVKYGPLTTIFFIGFTSYAIAKHRLMDIRMVVARSVSYTLLIAIMAGFYAGSIIGIERIFFPNTLTGFNWTQGIIRTILAVVMAFTFQPLRKWITKVTDKIFFKNQYEPEALLDTLAHTIGSTIVLIELLYKTLEILTREMKITRGIIVVLNENGSIYNYQLSNYKTEPKIIPHDMAKLAHDGILIYDELEEGSHYKNLLRKYDVSAAIPLKTDKDIQGILLLGEKASGDMYSQNDLKVFEIIAPEFGVAITNAKSFEKIEKFNVTLRQEIKKATAELEKKNEQLRELDKAKDEFISMASHQLRTPLTAIKGYLSMLLEGDAGEIKVSQYDFVNEAFSGANRMVGLINDLLNVSRMETGRFFIEPVEIDMERVAGEEVKQLQNHAKEKKLKLTLSAKGKIPHVMADETKIRQVMMNFIDNAVYYTTEGSVTVTLDHDKSNVIFKVEDTGIGVPKEQQKNLFTKFYRADNARHVRPDGTGLGIYLAKRVMDDHGGELIFHSVEGKGSTFGFKLPIKSKLKMKQATAPAPSPGSPTTPAIGELAAGVGVNPAVLENTKAEVGPTITPGSPIATGDVIASKAAGIEPPLPDKK